MGQSADENDEEFVNVAKDDKSKANQETPKEEEDAEDDQLAADESEESQDDHWQANDDDQETRIGASLDLHATDEKDRKAQDREQLFRERKEKERKEEALRQKKAREEKESGTYDLDLLPKADQMEVLEDDEADPLVPKVEDAKEPEPKAPEPKAKKDSKR